MSTRPSVNFRTRSGSSRWDGSTSSTSTRPRSAGSSGSPAGAGRRSSSPSSTRRSCVNRHLGYVIGGHLHVLMDDGTELDIVRRRRLRDPARSRRVGRRRRGVRRRRVRERADLRACTRRGGRASLATILFTDIVDSTATLAGSATPPGGACCSTTTTSCGPSWTGSADARSSRPATASWPCSTARPGPSGVPRP